MEQSSINHSILSEEAGSYHLTADVNTGLCDPAAAFPERICGRLAATPAQNDNEYHDVLQGLCQSHFHKRSTDDACDVYNLQKQAAQSQTYCLESLPQSAAVTGGAEQELARGRSVAPPVPNHWTEADLASVVMNPRSDAVIQSGRHAELDNRSSDSSMEHPYPLQRSVTCPNCYALLEQNPNASHNTFCLQSFWEYGNAEKEDASPSFGPFGASELRVHEPRSLISTHESSPTVTSVEGPISRCSLPECDSRSPLWYDEEWDTVKFTERARTYLSRGYPRTLESARPSSVSSHSTVSRCPPHVSLSGNQEEYKPEDMLLVSWRESGMSYQAIKQYGGFEEAESTLRGRFRKLTKRKDQRPRRPHWTKKDIQLLREAVSRFETQMVIEMAIDHADQISAGDRLKKLPWKKIAKHIEEQGGFLFGNYTCKKKYLELIRFEKQVDSPGKEHF